MSNQTFDPSELEAQETYFLFTSLIVPRPIAWVSTMDANGVRNLAPFSYFNGCSARPPIVHFTPTTENDTLRNVRATGEFVVNIVSHELHEAMRVSSAEWPPEVDEFEKAGLATAASTVVRPPRVALAKAAMECKVRTILPMGEGHMVFGDVLRFHVSDTILESGRVSMERLRPVGRLSGNGYSTVANVERLGVPDWAQQPKAAGGRDWKWR